MLDRDPRKPWGRTRTLIAGLIVASCAGTGAAAISLATKDRPSGEASSERGCVEELAAGSRVLCGRLSDGSVHCVGEVPAHGLQQAPLHLSAFPPATRLFVTNAVCAGTGDGALRCMGSNVDADLGLPAETKESATPVLHPLQRVTQLTPSGCALAGGELYCWRSFKEAASPRAVPDLPAPVLQITGGRSYHCALFKPGEVRCRGTNLRGQLGIPTLAEEPDAIFTERASGRPFFTRVVGLSSDVVQIASGNSHNCALKADGTVWCWGSNSHGQIGNGQVTQCKSQMPIIDCAPDDVLSPSQVLGIPEPVKAISLGVDTSCALTRSGKLWCWGKALVGHLVADRKDGFWVNSGDVTRPVLAPLAEPVTSVVLGETFTCARLESRRVRCWGTLGYSQVGWRDAKDIAFPCR